MEMEQDQNLSEFFEESEFRDASSFCSGLAASPDDIFSILEALEKAAYPNARTAAEDVSAGGGEDSFEFQHSACFQESETEFASFVCKKQKLEDGAAAAAATSASASASQVDDGQPRISHITVERNRRKQMNEHLAVLRSLMPCFYVKRGDQASIIGGVINYINELQQVVQSLESKRQRKTYADVLSPRPVLSTRPSPLSPRMPPLSPRILPISPRTPQPGSPYKPGPHILHTAAGYLNSPSLPSPVELSPCNSSTSTIIDSVNELAASSKSALAEVEVKFSCPNLLVKTVSHRIPGQAVKIVSALEELALEILQVNMSTVEARMVNSFTVKIGIECQLSAEELADHIQQTFSYEACRSTVC